MDTIDKINLYLCKTGHTGAELSRALGLSNSIYSQWNKKKTRPSMARLPAIAKYLGVEVEDLLPDNEKAPSVRPDAGDPLNRQILDLFDKLPENDKESVLSLLRSLTKDR